MNPFSLITDLLGFLLGGIWGLIKGLINQMQRPIEFSLVHLTTFLDRNLVAKAIGGFGLAVVVVTLVIRTLLSKLYAWQMRAQVKAQEDAAKMRPHLAKLRKEFGSDRQGMVAAQQALYKEHGLHPLSPLAGCLPLVVQMPVLYGLFYGIRSAVQNLGPDERGFLWIGDVSRSGLEACCKLGGSAGGYDASRLLGPHWTVLLFPIFAATLTMVQSRMMLPPPNPNASDQDRVQQQVGQSMIYAIPLVILVSGVSLPQGLTIYWTVNSALMISQQYYMFGWGQMRMPAWLPGAGRETELSRRKRAAALGVKPANLSRLDAGPRAAKGSAAPRVAAATTGVPDGEGGSGAGGDAVSPAAPSRQSGRAKSRSARPQNRKRRR